ncbi:MAG: tetratricopeptide repeat protein [Bacteroidales bacterium]|nr:tetratricopeptide repeat protein [Bacteroidales bacterium]
MKIPILFICFTLLWVRLQANIFIPDSIIQQCKLLTNDSQRCEFLINKAQSIKGNHPKLSFELANKALFYAEQSNFIQGMAKAYNLLGSIKCDIGEFVTAIEYHSKAFERAKFVKDYFLLAETYNYMGNVAYAQGKYTKAIEYYKESLKYSDKANSKSHMLNNLYRLGLIYETLDNLNDAYRCYKRSLLIEEELKNKEGIFYSIMGIASVSAKKENFDQAYILYNKALAIAQELQILSYQSLVFSKLGDLAKVQKKYMDALNYYSKALKIADSIDFYKDQKKCYYNLAYTNEKLEYYKDAYHYLSRYVALNDTLYNSDVAQQIARLQMRFDLKSKEKEIEQLRYKEEQRTRERNFLLIGSSLLFVILILLILLVVTRLKHAKMLKLQNIELIHQKEELNSALDQLNELNKELKKSNDQITESLQYAAFLQQTLLPFEHQFRHAFHHSFIFNKPKHLVSGDFAWIHQINHTHYFAIADCTGHGLAGALVSIKGFSLLNQAIMNLNDPTPSDILNWLNTHWNSYKTEHSEFFNNDSMEIAVFKLHHNIMKLEYSTANLRFAVANHNNEVNIYNNHEYCIGNYYQQSKIHFSTDSIILQPGNTLYLFTDGFPDQFGEKKQKLMINSFVEHLRSLSKFPIEKQREIIADFFNSWKGKEQQTDDVLVIGINFQ